MAVYKSKSPTKDGRQYYFRIKYKDIFGKVVNYKSRMYEFKKDAEVEEAKYRIKIDSNETTTNVTLDKVFTSYLAIKEDELKTQSVNKIKDRYKHLSILGSVCVNDIGVNHISKLKQSIKSEHLSISYSNKILLLLRTLIKHSKKYYGTSDRILDFIDNFKNANEIKKEMQFYTYEEYKQFDSVIDNLEWHTFFEVLYFLGLRCGECQALTWDDINFIKKEIRINKTLTSKIKGKNYVITSPKTKNSIRVLPIPENVLNDLKMLNNGIIKYKDYKSSWFVFGGSIPFKESTIFANKNKYCSLSGVKQIRIHDFRHSTASLLINKGASIVLVSKYLGHSNISITLNTYTHLYKNELEDITKMLNKL